MALCQLTQSKFLLSRTGKQKFDQVLLFIDKKQPDSITHAYTLLAVFPQTVSASAVIQSYSSQPASLPCNTQQRHHGQVCFTTKHLHLTEVCTSTPFELHVLFLSIKFCVSIKPLLTLVEEDTYQVMTLFNSISSPNYLIISISLIRCT